MQYATVARQLQVWEAFFVEETWLNRASLSTCLDDILTGAAPVTSDKVSPGLHPGDIDDLIEAARRSGDVGLIDTAERCAALGNMYMDALDVADGKNVRPVLDTLH